MQRLSTLLAFAVLIGIAFMSLGCSATFEVHKDVYNTVQLPEGASVQGANGAEVGAGEPTATREVTEEGKTDEAGGYHVAIFNDSRNESATDAQTELSQVLELRNWIEAVVTGQGTAQGGTIETTENTEDETPPEQ